MTQQVDPVRLGFVPRTDHEWFIDMMRREDVRRSSMPSEGYRLGPEGQAAVKWVRETCMGRPLVFGYYFLGKRILDHIAEIDALIRPRKRAIVRIGRGLAKSVTYAEVETQHDICYALVPSSGYQDPRILIAQESGEAAKFTMNSIRGPLQTGGPYGLIHAAFNVNGKTIPELATTWAGDNLVIPAAGTTGKNPTVLVTSVGGALQGLHPKKVILDDVATQKNSRTPHQRSIIKNWAQLSLFGTFSQNTKVWSLCTPVAQGDFNDWLASEGGYTVIERPALSRWPTTADYERVLDDAGKLVSVRITEAGRDLASRWPCPLGTGNCPGTDEHELEVGEHQSVEWLLDAMLRDPLGFASQRMLKLTSDEEARFHVNDMRFFSFDRRMVGKTAENYNASEILAFPDKKDIIASVHAWDHAFGKKRVNNETSMSAHYRDKGGNVFGKTLAGRWSVDEVLDMVPRRWDTDPFHKPMAVVMEAIGGQRDRSELVLVDRHRERRNRPLPPIEMITTAPDKDTALIESGLPAAVVNGVFYWEYEDKETIEQALMFTPSQRFADDRVDSNRLAFQRIRSAVRQRVKVTRWGVNRRFER